MARESFLPPNRAHTPRHSDHTSNGKYLAEVIPACRRAGGTPTPAGHFFRMTGSKQTALMFAALTGRAKMVEFLLKAGADATVADKSGNTALSLAKTQGANDVVKLLTK